MRSQTTKTTNVYVAAIKKMTSRRQQAFRDGHIGLLHNLSITSVNLLIVVKKCRKQSAQRKILDGGLLVLASWRCWFQVHNSFHLSFKA